MTWVKKKIDEQEVANLTEYFSLDRLAATILTRRGITKADEICFFIEDDLRFLHNPFLFKDMVKTVDRIKKAISRKEKIWIYGDRDVDGITATVLMLESLLSFNADVCWSVPQGDDDYGLSIEDIDNAIDQGAQLIITVDCGISNIDEISYAQKKGVDTIIIDHHNTRRQLPPAYTIINPKVKDCGYMFKDLAGCAVVSKLDWALHFSKSEYYKRVFCLINIRPLNDSFIVEAIKLENMVETDRFQQTLVPGIINLKKTKLWPFIQDCELIVYNSVNQRRLGEKLFGSDMEMIQIKGIADTISTTFPSLAGKSLLGLKQMSKMARYSCVYLGEIDILKNIFITLIFKQTESLTKECFNRLDLVTLGTLADLMPIMDENRILVKKGLNLINRYQRSSLRELILKRNLYNKNISTRDLSWQITPVINASGRLGEPQKAVEFFLTKEEDKISSLADYLFNLNDKRRQLGDKIWKKMIPVAEECLKKTEDRFVFLADNTIQRGITGIIATRMVKYFKVPALVVAILKHKAVGSLRSIKTFKIGNFLESFKDIFTDYGGHDYAGGFNLPIDKLRYFEKRFFEIVKNLKFPETYEENINIDAEIPPSYIKPELWKILDLFKPFGQANPPLVFFTKGLKLLSCEILGRKEQVHLKMLLDTGYLKIPAMFWRGAEYFGTNFNLNDKIDIIYNLSVNSFQNSKILQLIIIDIVRSGEKEVMLAQN